MNYSISIIDLLTIHKEILTSYRSTFGVYSGLSVQDIPLGTVFNYLSDKDSGVAIHGKFKIEHIIVLGKPSHFIQKGYNALLFISSDLTIESITNSIPVNEKGNFENLCYLTTEIPFS